MLLGVPTLNPLKQISYTPSDTVSKIPLTRVSLRHFFFLFWKKVEVELFFFRFSSVFPSIALSSKKNQKTHELRDLDVGLQIALESAEEDLSLARLEPVDHAGDGAAER